MLLMSNDTVFLISVSCLSLLPFAKMMSPRVGFGLLVAIFEGGLLWLYGRVMVFQGGSTDTQFPCYLDDLFWIIYLTLNRFLTAFFKDFFVRSERKPLLTPEDLERVDARKPVEWAWIRKISTLCVMGHFGVTNLCSLARA